MANDYLTPAEFARLARTTKRTVVWYDQKDILKPIYVNPIGYRFYKPEQIIDFQAILLLRKMNFSLEEIKAYLDEHKDLKALFADKKEILKIELQRLEKGLKDVEGFYKNLEKDGVLVSPTIKQVKAFDIYYIDVVGSYAKIKEYGQKLKSCFDYIPQDATYLTIFINKGYEPKKAEMRIAVIKTKEMKVKNEAKEIVKEWTVPAIKALTHLHMGSSALLSLLWKELATYAQKKGFEKNKSLPFNDYELYRKTSFNNFDDPDNMEFEIVYPIVSLN